MSHDPITRSELDAKFETVNTKLDTIIAHGERINGRLDKVEKKVEEHDKTIFRVKTLWSGGAVVVGTFYHQIIDGVKKWLTS